MNKQPPFAPELCDIDEYKDDRIKRPNCLGEECRHYCDGKCYFPEENLAGWLDWQHGIVREEPPLKHIVRVRKFNTKDLAIREEKLEFDDELEALRLYELLRVTIEDFKNKLGIK
jgi:hypothetical protein